MKSIIFYGSIGLNIAYTLFVFFRPALNKILENIGINWFVERRKKKEILKVVHNQVKKLKTITLPVFSHTAFIAIDKLDSALLTQQSLQKWGEVNNEIEENELILPEKARKEYRHFRDRVKVIGSYISKKGASKEEIKQFDDEVQVIIEKILSEIEKGM